MLPDLPHPLRALSTVLLLAGALACLAQQPPPSPADASETSLPDAPGVPASTAPVSSAQTGAQPSETGKRQKADEQVKEEEKQRILGLVPAFGVSYRSDAVSLTAKQKFRLAFRSGIDPAAFVLPLFVAGYGEFADSDNGFGWGASGFGERAGAAYLDAFDATMIGNGFLPAVLHQDPRYFRRGHGSVSRRLLYAIATSVICKHDNTGKWEPNYSNVAGNIASGALSNLYYPHGDSGASLTIENGLIVTGEGTIGAVFQEFWPDLSRKFLHKDPTHGLDAQARAADKTATMTAQDRQ